MMRCWAADADQRATFSCIIQSLNDYRQQLLINSTFIDDYASKVIKRRVILLQQHRNSEGSPFSFPGSLARRWSVTDIQCLTTFTYSNSHQQNMITATDWNLFMLFSEGDYKAQDKLTNE